MQTCIWTQFKIRVRKNKLYFIKIFGQTTISYNSFWHNCERGTVRMHGYYGNAYLVCLKAEKFILNTDFTLNLPII